MIKASVLICLLAATFGNVYVHCHPLTSQQLPFGSGHSSSYQSGAQIAFESSPSAFSLDHQEEITYHIDGIPFFSPNLPVATIAPHAVAQLSLRSAFAPIAVISPPSFEGFTGANLAGIIQEYLDSDDVIISGWLSTIILRMEDDGFPPIQLAAEEEALLRERFGVERVHFLRSGHLSEASGSSASEGIEEGLPAPPLRIQGPFLAKRNLDGSIDLLPVFRLHSDIYRTFIVGIYPTFGGSYNALRMVDAQGYNLIPVPSKLYSSCTEEDNGVCGARIAVKDIYDVSGVVTSAGSRAWGEFTGKASQSASSIQRLVNLGGMLVGKTKTASFAVGSLGHEETVDEHPFSARGDLWQSCVGSSSGSGCAMGAYDWLELAIGSDTGGSVRGPAAVVGLYGNRPSHGALPLDGVVPLVDYSDTAGFLTRDPSIFSTVMRSWYADSPLKLQKYPQIPARILLDAEFGQNHTSPAFNITNQFLDQVRQQLGVEVTETKVDEVLSAANWTWARIGDEISDQGWFSWERNGKRLYESYARQHDGRSPPSDPHIREFWRQARDKNWTRDDYESVLPKLANISAVVNDQLLGDDLDACSRNFLIYDIGTGGRPLYREKNLNEGVQNSTRSNDDQRLGLLCPLAGCVDVTIPIGQVSYMSNISEHEEMAPVTVSVVARKGCDFMIADFVDRLTDAGLISTVKTGRTAF